MSTISAMGRKPKKPPTGGQHTTPRTTVQFPTKWLAIARRIAATRQQPMMWYLVGRIAQDAKELGLTDLPELPWEQSPGE